MTCPLCGGITHKLSAHIEHFCPMVTRHAYGFECPCGDRVTWNNSQFHYKKNENIDQHLLRMMVKRDRGEV